MTIIDINDGKKEEKEEKVMDMDENNKAMDEKEKEKATDEKEKEKATDEKEKEKATDEKVDEKAVDEKEKEKEDNVEKDHINGAILRLKQNYDIINEKKKQSRELCLVIGTQYMPFIPFHPGSLAPSHIANTIVQFVIQFAIKFHCYDQLHAAHMRRRKHDLMNDYDVCRNLFSIIPYYYCDVIQPLAKNYTSVEYKMRQYVIQFVKRCVRNYPYLSRLTYNFKNTRVAYINTSTFHEFNIDLETRGQIHVPWVEFVSRVISCIYK
jgi:hypothetical protein